MKYTLLAGFLLSGLVLSQVKAQTKRIAHRSHHGPNASFSMKGLDNFGMAPGTVRVWDSLYVADQKRKMDSLVQLNEPRQAGSVDTLLQGLGARDTIGKATHKLNKTLHGANKER